LGIWKSDKLFFMLCWATYLSAYLCRINLSSALEKMAPGLGVEIPALGLLGSLFFITYAIGQLINGFIGDRVIPKRFILIALSGTALANLLISLSKSYVVVLLLWCANGYFQSMFWGPLMRMLSMRFSPESGSAVATGMSTSMTAAYILSWSVLGIALVNQGWQTYFGVPFYCALFMLALWALYLIFGRRSYTAYPAAAPNDIRILFAAISKYRLWRVCIVCICQGIIKDGVTLWAPIILSALLGFNMKQSPFFLILFPLANFGGALLSGALSKRLSGNIQIPMRYIFSGVLLCCVLLMVPGMPAVASVILMACISALIFGCNNILLGIVPLSFAQENIVSSLAGIFDFSAYVGAAISALALGIVVTSQTIVPIAAFWLAAGVIAFFALLEITPNVIEQQEERNV